MRDKPTRGVTLPNNSRRATSLGLLLLAAFVPVVPFLKFGPACGIDFIFHFVSWQDALRSWQHGIFYPHWTLSPNFNAGEPRFVFYPPLIWMLGAALGALLPWFLVPTALIFILLVGTALATRALARQTLSEEQALLAGLVAVFSGYNLYEIYHHGDFALLSGGMWIPLLLLLWFQVDFSTENILRAKIDRNLLLLSLALAGTWLSNTPLGLMATYMLVVLGLIAAIQLRSWLPLFGVAVAIAIGLGISSFYLIPAAAEQRWIDITRLFASPDHIIENRWITSELARPGSHAFPSQRIRGVIEAVMVAMALGGLGLMFWRGLWPSREQRSLKRWWWSLGTIACFAFFLMLPVSLPIWNLLPRLRYLQYPWRWLVVLQAPMAILFAAGVLTVRRSSAVYTFAACFFIFLSVTIVASSSRSFYLLCPTSPSAPNSIAGINRALQPDGIGVGGYEEYASPPGSHNDLSATRMPDGCLVRDPLALLSQTPATQFAALYTPRMWSPASGTCDEIFTFSHRRGSPEHLLLNAEVIHTGYIVLRLRSYPAWQVLVNGIRVSDLTKRSDGLVVIPVRAGNLRLQVDWGTTPDVTLGRWLSAFTLVLTLVLWHRSGGLLAQKPADDLL